MPPSAPDTPARPAPSRSPSISAGQTPAPAPAASGTPSQAPQPQPNPLDRLSQQDLRIKLDSSRRELRAYIDRKKKIDRDLVRSPSPRLQMCGEIITRSRADRARVIRDHLQANLESSIYAFEGSYLSDQLLGPPPTGANQPGPAQFGNIIKGQSAPIQLTEAPSLY